MYIEKFLAARNKCWIRLLTNFYKKLLLSTGSMSDDGFLFNDHSYDGFILDEKLVDGLGMIFHLITK
jgi:hypothetical protein